MIRDIKILLVILLSFFYSLAQQKVEGIVVDDTDQPVPYASVVFLNSVKGTITDENGHFYMESETDTYKAIEVRFLGFKTKVITLQDKSNSDIKIKLLPESEQLNEIVLFPDWGKRRLKKEENPAYRILKKLWKRRRKNGVYMFDRYEYEKYEKIEFDLNNIDSAMIKNKFFRGMEFIFDNIDTSHVTGKSFLPVFINESIYDVYGQNKPTSQLREDIKANKTSGFEGEQNVVAFIKDLYIDYDVYGDYINLFNKDFEGPLSKNGFAVYNYVLADSAYIDDKWCYNIAYYPIQKTALAFRGNFWVNDTTFAVKKINLHLNKNANINWVKDIYMEKTFEVVNDSVFLLKRDYVMSDFSLSKKRKSKGLYGKRTTMYKNYNFDTSRRPEVFYTAEKDPYDVRIYKKDDSYWDKKRHEKLNSHERGIYKMVDTLETVPKYKRIYNTVSILTSGYIKFNKLAYGPIYSTVGFNDVEGIRLRAGMRTYFGKNDLWRLQGYMAYGLRDRRFKYSLSGKWLAERKNRIILGLTHSKDVEQIAVRLNDTDGVLRRGFASSGLFARGRSDRLTMVEKTAFSFSAEPWKNVEFRFKGSHAKLTTASESFNLDYWEDAAKTIRRSNLIKTDMDFSVSITPGREPIGYGVERILLKRHMLNINYPTVRLNYTKGLKGVFDSDFAYQKLQLYYRQPWQMGGFGRLFSTVELGKTFGEVPLGLLNIVPGNQSYWMFNHTFSLIDYYEFVADTYSSLFLEQHFNGRLFSYIPGIRDLGLREVIGVRGIWGTVSPDNMELNASPLTYRAPGDIYWEYHAGIGNIFKLLRIDFIWRGNYRNQPGATNFGIKGSIGFYF